MFKTKEFLKSELDKLDRNAYWEIDGYGNTEYICKVMELYAEAAKNNMAGTVGFQACGDEGVSLSVKQEAQPIASGVGGWFTIDFFEFAVLVEACIPPKPIARTSFWKKVINEYFHEMTDKQRTHLWEWLNKNDRYRESVKKEKLASIFEDRFNPNNQYEVIANNEKHRCFLRNGRYYTKIDTWIAEEHIQSVTKL
jgi:hypothetical protein